MINKGGKGCVAATKIIIITANTTIKIGDTPYAPNAAALFMGQIYLLDCTRELVI
jgi:hypothetical protein